jgi:hypothetical protein
MVAATVVTGVAGAAFADFAAFGGLGCTHTDAYIDQEYGVILIDLINATNRSILADALTSYATNIYFFSGGHFVTPAITARRFSALYEPITLCF